MSGTIPAMADLLAVIPLVSLVKLCNVCIVYRTAALSYMQNYAPVLRVVPIGSNSW